MCNGLIIAMSNWINIFKFVLISNININAYIPYKQKLFDVQLYRVWGFLMPKNLRNPEIKIEVNYSIKTDLKIHLELLSGVYSELYSDYIFLRFPQIIFPSHDTAYEKEWQSTLGLLEAN